jgi:Skp family chaperone for outer membrane proteins
MKRILKTLMLASLLATIHTSSSAQSAADSSRKSAQWRLAAINREWAAVTQENQAWVLVEQSETLKNKGYANEAERQKHLSAAATALQRTGDLEMKASRNFDMATKNWKQVTYIQKKQSEGSSSRESIPHAEANTANAVDAVHRACGRYELASDIYRDLGPKWASKSAALSEKAASCREALARR